MKQTLAGFVQDPARMAEYREWLRSPVTREIVEILEAIAAPEALDVTTAPAELGNRALYLLGHNVGASKVIQTIVGIEQVYQMFQMASARGAIASGYTGDGTMKGQ